MSKMELSKIKLRSFRFFALVFSVVVAFAILEVFLRLGALLGTPPVISPYEKIKYDAPENFLILAVGDSHTEGVGAEDGFSYPNQLLRILEKANPDIGWVIFNEGVAGYNSSQALLKVVEFFKDEYPPNLVLMCAGTNNNHNLTAATFLPKELRNQKPRLQWAYLFRNVRTYRLGQVTFARIKKILSNEEVFNRDLFHDVIKDDERFLYNWIRDDLIKANQIATDKGAKFVSVGYAINVSVAHQTMKDLSKEKGIPYILNLEFGLPILFTRMDLMAPCHHPNEKGYAIIAIRIARYLAKNNLAPVTPEQIEKALAEFGY